MPNLVCFLTIVIITALIDGHDARLNSRKNQRLHGGRYLRQSSYCRPKVCECRSVCQMVPNGDRITKDIKKEIESLRQSLKVTPSYNSSCNKNRNSQILEAIGNLKQDLLASQIQLTEKRCGHKSKKKNPASLQKVKGRDCLDLYKKGIKKSGVYQIWPFLRGPKAHRPILAYCDMKTNGGGWTVFQRRENGFVRFFRGWYSYRTGFGNPTGEHWLGNDAIHELTKARQTELRIDLENWIGKSAYAKYSSFFIDDIMGKYTLHISGFSGTLGDSLKYHNGQPFSTYDKDHDPYKPGNCAIMRYGAWWYNKCVHSNLNGRYFFRTLRGDGVYWKHWKGNGVAIMKTKMMLRVLGFQKKSG